jgi:transposase-like protein
MRKRRRTRRKDRGITLSTIMERFSSEEEAIELVEKMRWPKGPVCPDCRSRKIYRLNGAKCRPGLIKCAKCGRQFTVKVGMIFEDSHVPLRKWLLAIHLMCASKKGVSSHQVARALGVQVNTAWFMTHRLRHAVHDSVFRGTFKGIVEADECYVGGRTHGGKRGRGAPNKNIAFGLVERGGRVRPFHVDRVTAKTLKGLIRENVDRGATVNTDELKSYRGLATEFRKHLTVNHGKKEYARGPANVNTCESFWALLKRGVHGTFHHLSRRHFYRYLDEFAFRFNMRKSLDGERILRALKLAKGKRLYYRAPAT